MSSNKDGKVDIDLSGTIVPNQVNVEEPPKSDPGFFGNIGNAIMGAVNSGHAKAFLRPINMNGQAKRK